MNEQDSLAADWDPDAVWYHGSPCDDLEVLKTGSSITQIRRLAEAFSHKPALLCIEHDGRIRHDGAARGWLYEVKDRMTGGAIRPHPATTMPPGHEWLICRPMRVRLLGEVHVSPDELLCREEAEQLRRHGDAGHQ